MQPFKGDICIQESNVEDNIRRMETLQKENKEDIEQLQEIVIEKIGDTRINRVME